MDCEQAIERLPWLLNSTLWSPKSGASGAHVASCEACRQALDETRLAWQVFDEHLPAEVLTALAADEEPGIDRRLAERHLAECPRCAAELEMVRASRALLENEGVATLPLLGRVRPAGEGAGGAGAAPPWRPASPAWWPRPAGTTARATCGPWQSARRRRRRCLSQASRPSRRARLAGAVAGPEDSPTRHPGRGEPAPEPGQLRRRPNASPAWRPRKRRPRRRPPPSSRIAAVNTLVVDVYPDTVVRGQESGGGNRIELPASSDLYTLLLHPPGEAPARAEIVIVDAGGREVWKSAGLVKSSADDYTVTLGRGLLPAGAYTVRLYAAGDRKTPVATFPLTLR